MASSQLPQQSQSLAAGHWQKPTVFEHTNNTKCVQGICIELPLNRENSKERIKRIYELDTKKVLSITL
jgi:hypothetical protein